MKMINLDKKDSLPVRVGCVGGSNDYSVAQSNMVLNMRFVYLFLLSKIVPR